MKLSDCKLFWNFCCLFSPQGSRLVCGPVLSVLSPQSGGPTPDECGVTCGPPTSNW